MLSVSSEKHYQDNEEDEEIEESRLNILIILRTVTRIVQRIKKEQEYYKVMYCIV